MRIFTVAVVLLLLATIPLSMAIENPEELVNMLAGTFTDGNHHSTGNTLPLISMPWGFNNWAPMTKEGSRRTGSWWFNGNDHDLTWMRCTHQPSPWIGDWGWFIFSPQITRRAERNPHHYWEPRGATIKPHLFDAIVAPYNIHIELTPTMHGAIARFTFPARNTGIYDEAGDMRVCFAEAGWGENGHIQESGKSIAYLNGRATQVNKDRMTVTGFGMHVRVTSETDRYLTTQIDHNGEMFCFKYTPTGDAPRGGTEGRTVLIRMATSFISQEQAQVTLARELPMSISFDEIALTAKSTWNK